MPWTKVVPVSQSYTTVAPTSQSHTKVAPASQSYTATTRSALTWQKSDTEGNPVWALPSPQPEAADGGVDFELRFREASPMVFSETRPLLFMSSLSEGMP